MEKYIKKYAYLLGFIAFAIMYLIFDWMKFGISIKIDMNMPDMGEQIVHW